MVKCNNQTNEEGKRRLPWLGAALLLAGWIVWRLWKGAPEEEAEELEPAPEPLEIPSRSQIGQAQAEAPATAEPDDLTRIEGIGPRVEGLLKEEGIETFTDLATATPATLKSILRGASLAFMDPSTWPQQAGLAAAGDWSNLEALQAELKGGRRG
jgi:predicted flap endonuclease-1-like 5' DNA nuclease